MFSGKYDDTVTSWLTGRHVESSYDLRNHRFSIYQSPIQFDTRKFSFTNRIISAWNSLPDSVVSAYTINTFKNSLNRFRKNQEVQFNWKADIDTGSRSQVNVILV